MLFKVSFRDTPNNPAKAVVVVGNKVSVQLSGIMKLPEMWKYLPDEIEDWIESNSPGHLGVVEDIATNTLHLKAFGHAKCHEEDKVDYVLGERLAEARAKLRLYRFFMVLTSKLDDYYQKLLFGEYEIVDLGRGDCINQDYCKYEKLYIRELSHIRELIGDRKNG